MPVGPYGFGVRPTWRTDMCPGVACPGAGVLPGVRAPNGVLPPAPPPRLLLMTMDFCLRSCQSRNLRSWSI